MGGIGETSIPCRVAFEAGAERSVKLVVGSRAKDACVSASMLLVETLVGLAATQINSSGILGSSGASRGVADFDGAGVLGVVRAVAPLAGCDAIVDASHKKWLHVRVRSPYSCLSAVARSPAGGGGGGEISISDAAAARRRLRDGHWTLAFEDDETCAAAKRMIDERAAMLRRACAVALRPFAATACET